MKPQVSLSVVSHNQAHLAALLLQDLRAVPEAADILLTNNVVNATPMTGAADPRVHLHSNALPLGFGANHNQAFRLMPGADFFAVVNPDIRLPSNPFPGLLDCLGQDPRIGLVVPRVISPAGKIEDSTRRFPTIGRLLRKLVLGDKGHCQADSHTQPYPVDWAAGMFMLFRREAFEAVGGFDDNFHLYYEDVDICVRLWKAGWRVVCDPRVQVVHDAQRASHRNPRHMAWHLTSMGRFLLKHTGRLPKIPTQSSNG